jgi:hypothetical protein
MVSHKINILINFTSPVCCRFCTDGAVPWVTTLKQCRPQGTGCQIGILQSSLLPNRHRATRKCGILGILNGQSGQRSPTSIRSRLHLRLGCAFWVCVSHTLNYIILTTRGCHCKCIFDVIFTKTNSFGCYRLLQTVKRTSKSIIDRLPGPIFCTGCCC